MQYNINFHELNSWSYFDEALKDQSSFINKYKNNALNKYSGYSIQENGTYTVIQIAKPYMDIIQIVFNTFQKDELFIVYIMKAPDPYAWDGLTSCLDEEFREVGNGRYIHKNYTNINITIGKKKYIGDTDVWTVQLYIKR